MIIHFRKLFTYLDDRNYPSLGVILNLSTFSGLWYPEFKSVKSRFKFLIFLSTLSYFGLVYLKFLRNINLESLKEILRFMPFHLGFVKCIFLRKDNKTWKEMVEFASNLERKQLAENDPTITKSIRTYIYRSKFIALSYILLAYISNIFLFSEPYKKNKITESVTDYIHIFDGYTLFNEDKINGYYCSIFFQTVFGNIITLYVLLWDLICVTIMMFMAAQLRISGLHCSRMINSKSIRKSHANIVECYNFHRKLVLYQRKFNALISPVMFIYIIIATVNLGVCIIQITENADTVLAGSIYMLALFVQLLLFYWHSNEVTLQSQRVSYNTFKSDWVGADPGLQRHLVLLAWATDTRLVFKAGPFNEMSLSTFVSILRGSYSFYTLLSRESTN